MARRKRPAWFEALVETYEVLYPPSDLTADPIVGWRRRPATGFVWHPGDLLLLGSRPPFLHEAKGLDLGPFTPFFPYRISHLTRNGYRIEVAEAEGRPRARLVPIPRVEDRAVAASAGPLGPRYPLRLDDPAAAARVATELREAGYTEERLLSAFGLGDLSDIGEVTPGLVDVAPLDARLRLAVRLLLMGQQRTMEEAASVLGAPLLDALLALDLLTTNGWGDLCHATAWAYPVDGFLVVSDRLLGIGGDPLPPDPDAVFPAIDSSSLFYLAALRGLLAPGAGRAGARALDVGTGAGVGALVLARAGMKTVAVDVNPRAVHFARFNAALNGLTVDARAGDVLTPVAGQRFDVITSHMPYVPGDPMPAQDGGATGEAMSRRLVRALPRHLAGGGVARLLGVGLDTATRPFQRRLRSWLGTASPRFDVTIGTVRERAVEEFLEIRAGSGQDVTSMREAFAAERATRLVHAVVTLRRHRRPSRPVTRRVPWDPGAR